MNPKRIPITLHLAGAALLAGCNALGGVPAEAITNAKNAAASCIRVESLAMGKAVVTTANDVKGAIDDGSIVVDPETCKITITNRRPAPEPKLK